MIDIIIFGVGDCIIINYDGKIKILSYVVCLNLKCLVKMKNERFVW